MDASGRTRARRRARVLRGRRSGAGAGSPVWLGPVWLGPVWWARCGWAVERGSSALARTTAARDTEVVPDELTWDQRILRLIEPGIDVTQIDRNLKLTPTERLEQMDAMLRDLEEMRGTPRVDRSPSR